MKLPCKKVLTIGGAIGLALWQPTLVSGQSAEGEQPILPTEESDVATLAPASSQRIFLLGSNGLVVLEGDDPKLKSLGTVPIGVGGVAALASDASKIYVSESYYSHGNRGTRSDIVSVYDGQTLNLEKEIPLPGRLRVNVKTTIFGLGEGGRYAYVYDMVPASAAHVVDLQEGKVVTSVDLPGCATMLPVGPDRFGTICGDGSVGTATVSRDGESKVVFSDPIFDATQDPVFEEGLIDKTTGEGWLISFTGRIFPVVFNATPKPGKPWSILGAAGLREAGPNAQEMAWRPGGRHPVALHRASKRLFVLMHVGNHWSQKQGGTEIWVLDAEARTLIRRIPLNGTGKGVMVSQGEKPLVYAMDVDGKLIVFDGETGEEVSRRTIGGSKAWVPGY